MLFDKNIVLSCALVISSMQITDAQAAIALNPANPHYFVDNGKTIVLVGGANVAPAIHGASPNKAQLDSRSLNGSNYGRIWSVLPWEGTNTYFPWARTTTGSANDGGAKFDLTLWDDNYWNAQKATIEYAATKNVYLQYMVFDEVGLEKASNRWNQHPFNPDNNVNGLTLPSGNTRAVEQYYDLTNSKLLAFQEAYVAKLLTETCAYGNIIYEVVNETTAPWAWQQHFIDFIKDRCPRLVSNNPFAFLTENLNYNRLDIVNFHNLTADNVNSTFNQHYAKSKILKYDEQAIGYNAIKDIRQYGWAAITGGGHINYDESGNVSEANKAADMIGRFLRTVNVNFSKMSPHNELVNNGYALAEPGTEYLIYTPSGGTILVDLASMSGTSYYKWYDPDSGIFSTDSNIPSGNQVSFTSPYSNDVVLFISNKPISATLLPPGAPTGEKLQITP